MPRSKASFCDVPLRARPIWFVMAYLACCPTFSLPEMHQPWANAVFGQSVIVLFLSGMPRELR